MVLQGFARTFKLGGSGPLGGGGVAHWGGGGLWPVSGFPILLRPPQEKKIRAKIFRVHECQIHSSNLKPSEEIF